RRRCAAPLVVRQLLQLAAVAVDDPGGRFVFAGPAPLEIHVCGIARPAERGRRIAHQLETAHHAVDGQRKRGRCTCKMSWRRDEHDASEYAAKTRRKTHEKVYNLLNRTSPPNVYCSEQRSGFFTLSRWSRQQCVCTSRFAVPGLPWPRPQSCS